jgi:hypothetical protein
VHAHVSDTVVRLCQQQQREVTCTSHCISNDKLRITLLNHQAVSKVGAAYGFATSVVAFGVVCSLQLQ